MSVVTVVANVGLGPREYRVLREGDEHRTIGRIDHYAHVMVVDEYNVDAAVEELEDRYNTSLSEAKE